MKQYANYLLPLLGLAIGACSAEDSGTLTTSSQSAALNASESYVILYKSLKVPAKAAAAIEAAGGSVVTSYAAIGVVIAESNSPSFADTIGADTAVQGVSATSGLATTLEGQDQAGPTASAVQTTSSGDPLSYLQWDMTQIHAPEAQAINPGSPSVVSAVLDSGIDVNHPDVASQIDYSSSVSCVGGVPDTDPSVWGYDFIGHGTHVAGIIAGAKNDIGITGVAPGTRVAAVKVADDNGFIFPESFICGITWAADHHLPLANVSLFIDPWYFACKDDPDQRAVWKAIQRAVKYAMGKGTSVIAAVGNTLDDLDHPTVDYYSPTTSPTTREITNACEILPVELTGVLGVSAVGATQQKAFYSNFGITAVDVTGPGGDFLIVTPEAETGQVVSSLPDYSLYYYFAQNYFGTAYQDCSSGTCYTYGGLQGTSQATPHATGVAALALSHFGTLSPDELTTTLEETATPLACPPNPYQEADWVPPVNCTGDADQNNFYGHGEVDALAVVQ